MLHQLKEREEPPQYFEIHPPSVSIDQPETKKPLPVADLEIPENSFHDNAVSMQPENLVEPNIAVVSKEDDLQLKSSGNDGVPPNSNFGPASSFPYPEADMTYHVNNILRSLDALQFKLSRKSQRLQNQIVQVASEPQSFTMEPGIQGLHKLANGHLLPGALQPISNNSIGADSSTRLTLKEMRVMGPQAKLHISDLEIER